jgi:hypothetical protein
MKNVLSSSTNNIINIDTHKTTNGSKEARLRIITPSAIQSMGNDRVCKMVSDKYTSSILATDRSMEKSVSEGLSPSIDLVKLMKLINTINKSK